MMLTVARRRSLALVAAVVLSTACAGSTRQEALRIAYTSLEATKDGFTTYVQTHGRQIINNATSEAEAKDKLGDFLSKADRVSIAIQAAFSALAVATLDAKAESLANAIQSAQDLYKLYKELKDDL